MPSTVVTQPEFATKFSYISVDENSYAPGTEDVLIAGRFNQDTGQLDSDGNPITLSRPVSLFVGTGGTLTFLQTGRTSGVPGNYTVLKNIPSGSFLPIIGNRILIKDLDHIKRYTNIGQKTTLDYASLNSVINGSYNVSAGSITTSGSGSDLALSVYVYTDSVTSLKTARFVVNSRTHVDYAAADTVTIASGWDGASAPEIVLTLTSAHIGTVPGTTADDIQIYF